MNRLNLFIFISAISLIFLGCQPYVEKFASHDESDELQSIRAEIIRDFHDNPVDSIKKYYSYYAGENGHSNLKVNIGRKLVIAGQLVKYDSQKKEVYMSFIRSELENSDPELQGIAVSALYQDQSEDSLLILLEKMKSQHFQVRVEALAAAKYAAISSYASAQNDTDHVLNIIRKYCSDQRNLSSETAGEFCDWSEQNLQQM